MFYQFKNKNLMIAYHGNEVIMSNKPANVDLFQVLYKITLYQVNFYQVHQVPSCLRTQKVLAMNEQRRRQEVYKTETNSGRKFICMQVHAINKIECCLMELIEKHENVN